MLLPVLISRKISILSFKRNHDNEAWLKTRAFFYFRPLYISIKKSFTFCDHDKVSQVL
jgi:hypothetical protein